jgi:hypothetical protein
MTGVEESNKNQKAVISFRNYPNPFNSSTYIHYSLIKPSTIKLYVFNVKGQLIQELEKGFRTPGEHHVVFDASRLPSGVYFCMLKAEHCFKIIKALKLN